MSTIAAGLALTAAPASAAGALLDRAKAAVTARIELRLKGWPAFPKLRARHGAAAGLRVPAVGNWHKSGGVSAV